MKQKAVLFGVVDVNSPHKGQVHVRETLKFHSFVKSRFLAVSPAVLYLFFVCLLSLFSRKWRWPKSSMQYLKNAKRSFAKVASVSSLSGE